MAYRYLGYGITNEQGIATLDHDANGDPITHSYTGTGAGEIDIVASLDDNEHISDSSIQSETYDVLDTVFYDKATDGTGEKNTNCYNQSSSTLSVTPLSDGTLLQCLSDSYWGAYFLNQQNSTSSPNPIGTVIEFDVIDVNSMNIYLTGNSDYYYAFSTTGHYKITVDSNNIKVFKQIDGVYTQLDSKTTSNYISDYYKVKFTKRGSANYIKYANFMIYPL